MRGPSDRNARRLLKLSSPLASEWLHDAPDHWTIRRIRTVAEMPGQQRPTSTPEEGRLPVRTLQLRGCIQGNDRITQRTSLHDRQQPRKTRLIRFRLNENDVVITKDSETWDDIGVPALVTEPANDLISGYHLAILRPRADTYGPHLFWALQSRPTAYQFHILKPRE